MTAISDLRETRPLSYLRIVQATVRSKTLHRLVLDIMSDHFDTVN